MDLGRGHKNFSEGLLRINAKGAQPNHSCDRIFTDWPVIR